MTKLKCKTCANQVNFNHCTRAFTMQDQLRKYKKCEGYKVYVASKPKPIIIRPKIQTNYAELGKFGTFLRDGGHWSLNK